MGWSLAGNRLPNYQKFLVLVGRGANGKSTILDVWRALLGETNVSHVSLAQFGEKFALASMRDKLANIAGDLQHPLKIAEGILKMLTGGDTIQVDRKRRDPITLTPTAKLIFAANELPALTDRSDGIWRRLIAMPFSRRFLPLGEGLDDQQFPAAERDPNRVARLLEELPGIFTWAIRGARALKRRGQFPDCTLCRDVARQHRHDSDPVLQWIEARVVIDENLTTPKSVAYQDYREWCLRSGCQPVAQARFGRQIMAMDAFGDARPRAGGSRERRDTGLGLISGRQ